MNYNLTFVLCQTYSLFRNQLRKLCQCASLIIYMRMASKSVYSQHIRNTTVVKRPWFVYRMIFLAPLMTIAVFSFYYLTCLPLLIPWTIQFYYSRFGIRGSALAWFHSYFKSRTQFVSNKGTSSSLHELICGVPQGSVLGPLLYVLYTSQVGDIIRKHGLSFYLYADDQQLYTSFFFENKTEMATATRRIEMRVSDIHTWMALNMLKLNTDKTELLYFNSKFRPYLQLNPIQLGSDVIHPSSHAKKIGVIFDSTMTMSRHINAVVKSGFYHLRNIAKVRNVLTLRGSA